ncbi:unnamed protein product [Diatraea saccharalis]|uniref:MADF domain-containing protein n=1 Tax=Diatraea saccharalis TaxID=40085 RepID=A0A9N9RA74_9NEOP|nr:unnamed protein product [Diatraea saccharalis]
MHYSDTSTVAVFTQKRAGRRLGRTCFVSLLLLFSNFNMNWDNETVLRFLELYQMNPCIWDPQNNNHRNRQRVNDAWNNIKESLGLPCSVRDLKKKKECLMSAYRSYKGKIKKSEISAADANDLYQPTWYAFPLMDSFLGSVYTCNISINEGEENEESSKFDTNATSETKDVLQERRKKSLPSMTTSSPSQHRPSNAKYTKTAITSEVSKRRQLIAPELIQAQKQMEEAFNLMKNAYQNQRSTDDDDECSIFGTLIAKKLRKLSEEERDRMMVKINQLFLERHVTSRPISATSYSLSPPVFEAVDCDAPTIRLGLKMEEVTKRNQQAHQ